MQYSKKYDYIFFIINIMNHKNDIFKNNILNIYKIC